MSREAHNVIPDDLHVTVEMVANFYIVEYDTIQRIIQRHRDEINTDGYRVLKGTELRFYKAKIAEQNVHLSVKLNLALLPRRADLRIGMLLWDSEVA